MSDQMAFDFTAVRASDPETSRLAAIFVFPNVEAHRARVLAALAHAGPGGLTDFELEQVVGIKQTSCGKRRGELRDAGLVEALFVVDDQHPCGKRPVRRLAPSGTPAQVWVVTDAGVEAAARLAVGEVA
jgi:hypothetical protein